MRNIIITDEQGLRDYRAPCFFDGELTTAEQLKQLFLGRRDIIINHAIRREKTRSRTAQGGQE